MSRLTAQRVDLAIVLRRVVASTAEDAGACALQVEVPAVPLPVLGDPDELGRVLTNLLSNAFKYSPRGGTVRLAAWPEGAQVHLAISDQGIGLAPEHLERVFEKYYRVPGQEGDQRTGSGLGLFICKRIVEAHGGRIWADSTPGRGSTFHVALPLIPPSPAEASPLATGGASRG
jgi:signal transduction histidine kinase